MDVITSYLFGRSSDKKALPVAAKFDEELTGGWWVCQSLSHDRYI